MWNYNETSNEFNQLFYERVQKCEFEYVPPKKQERENNNNKYN